jgi:hypothetical protein
MSEFQSLDLESPNHCPKCNDGLVRFVSGDFETGVIAPDGGRERRYEEGYQWDKCGFVEDEDDYMNSEGGVKERE